MTTDKDLMDELKDNCTGNCITTSTNAKDVCNSCQNIIRNTDEGRIMDLFIKYNNKIDTFGLNELIMVMSESDKINFIFSLLSSFEEEDLLLIKEDVKTAFKEMYFDITNSILKIKEK